MKPANKITPENYPDIKFMISRGHEYKVIAAQFSVSKSTITQINKHDTYALYKAAEREGRALRPRSDYRSDKYHPISRELFDKIDAALRDGMGRNKAVRTFGVADNTVRRIAEGTHQYCDSGEPVPELLPSVYKAPMNYPVYTSSSKLKAKIERLTIAEQRARDPKPIIRLRMFAERELAVVEGRA